MVYTSKSFIFFIFFEEPCSIAILQNVFSATDLYEAIGKELTRNFEVSDLIKRVNGWA